MNQPQQQQARVLPSFSGLSSAVNEARDYEKSRSAEGQQQQQHQHQQQEQHQQHENTNKPSGNSNSNNGNSSIIRRGGGRHETFLNGFEGRSVAPALGGLALSSISSKADVTAPNLLVQDTLTPLLDEVDALFECSKEIIASIKAQGNQKQEEDVRWCSHASVIRCVRACWCGLVRDVQPVRDIRKEQEQPLLCSVCIFFSVFLPSSIKDKEWI